MRIIFVLIAIFSIYFFAGLSEVGQAKTGSVDLSRLYEYMCGSFSSAGQAANDTSYFDIRLEMVPIWKMRSDALWIYVEQAVATHEDKPYRQRIYRLSQVDDSTFQSDVYTINEPLRFAGEGKKEIPMAVLTPDSLTKKDGCSIILRKRDDSTFVGSTAGQNCPSDLRGAKYATSEVQISAWEMISWDRGYDSTGVQVWGAENGGYIFKKLNPEQKTEKTRQEASPTQ